MTRQEMKKLLDELDRKRVETRDKKIMEESDDELACELENIEKESSDKNSTLPTVVKPEEMLCQ